MKIYTKTGDDGTTGLFGGTRVSKNSARIRAYGTIDELNAVIGLTLTSGCPEELRSSLSDLSSLLFVVGSDLATPLSPPPKYPIPRVEEQHIDWLESMIDSYTDTLPELKNFILPGGTPAGAYLHLARTVCRRAEREIVELTMEEEVGDVVVRFVNRLSDYLFVAARKANALAGTSDIPWIPIKR